MPSPNEPAYATTPRTGKPIRRATSPRASSRVPPPCDSTKPPRRRSLARLNRRSSMPCARMASVSAVADIDREADDALGAQVVEATGDDDVSLADADLVDAFLDRDRRGGARGDRVDHRPVAADVRLHDVGGDDVGQGLLQEVVRDALAEQVVDVERLHGGHAAHAGALRVGDAGRVDRLHELGRREAAGQERIDRADQVPQGDSVDRLDHLARDAPRGRVEPGRDLSADGAGDRLAQRHPDLGAGTSRHRPVARWRRASLARSRCARARRPAVPWPRLRWRR